MNVQAETVTLSEFVAEVLPRWLIERLDTMIIYIISDEEDTCAEEEEK